MLDQLGAEAVDLGVREPAVVGDDQRLRRPQPLGQLCDDLLLVTLQHLFTSLKRSSPHGGGLGKRRKITFQGHLGKTSALYLFDTGLLPFFGDGLWMET
jgi:hypothetical protein